MLIKSRAGLLHSVQMILSQNHFEVYYINILKKLGPQVVLKISNV